MNSPMSPEAYALTLSLLVKSVASNRGDEFSRTLSVNPSADPSQIKVSRERVEIGPPPRNADLVLLSHRILDSVKKFEERSRYASDDYIRELREAARAALKRLHRNAGYQFAYHTALEALSEVEPGNERED